MEKYLLNFLEHYEDFRPTYLKWKKSDIVKTFIKNNKQLYPSDCIHWYLCEDGCKDCLSYKSEHIIK